MPHRPNSTSAILLACAAGLAVPHANAADASSTDTITPIKLDYQTRAAGYDGYVYHAGLSGERIVTSEAAIARAGATRGVAWSWDNSVIDHCIPAAYTEEGLTVGIFTGIHSQDAGDAIDPFAVRYWGEWFEAPGDTIINGMSFSTFAQIVDVDNNGDGIGDGVEGLDWFLVFTEEDRLTDRSGATAHSPILIEGIPGSLDAGSASGDAAGDGVIGFQEAQMILQFIDFNAGDTPTDIEIADTNGVSDGAFGQDSIFSGIPGVDMSPTDGTDDAGVGLFNCGFVIGYRQPSVAEGDGLIDRYPELAGIGLENPEGLDPNTFPNILPVGTPLTGPSEREEANPAVEGSITLWPLDGVEPLPGEGVGAWDGMTLIDALGVDQGGAGGAFFFGGAACDPAAQAALTPPFYLNPWAGYDIAFNVNAFIEDDCYGGAIPCNPTDIAEPFGVLDLADIGRFVTDFQAGDTTCIDIAEPFGILDLADIGAFVTNFQAGCP